MREKEDGTENKMLYFKLLSFQFYCCLVKILFAVKDIHSTKQYSPSCELQMATLKTWLIKKYGCLVCKKASINIVTFVFLGSLKQKTHWFPWAFYSDPSGGASNQKLISLFQEKSWPHSYIMATFIPSNLISSSNQFNGPVSWVCRIHWQLLCKKVRLL